MSDAIKKLHDYLAESPSVVYPEDVLAYLPAIEAENAALRERCAKTLEVGTRWMAKAARFESENTKLRELISDYHRFADAMCAERDCDGCSQRDEGACERGVLTALECVLGVEVE